VGVSGHLPIGALAVSLLIAAMWAAPQHTGTSANAVAGYPTNSMRPGFFLENLGQIENPEVRYYLPGSGISIGFAESAVLFSLAEPEAHDPRDAMDEGAPVQARGPSRGALARLTFDGANRAMPEGIGEATYRSHFFLGGDPAGWRTQVRSYRQVLFQDLYEGVDLLYTAEAGPKYEFHLRPGVDPARITWVYEGVEEVALDPAGGLRIRTDAGGFTDSPPLAFQGGVAVPCAFQGRGPRSFGFDCEGIDPSQSLVIDPLIYSTFLGDVGQGPSAIAVDGSGSAYIASTTWSAVFPATPGAFDRTLNGTTDAFVLKLNPFGTGLEYATYLGGSSYDWAYDIAVDGAGYAYITGTTTSPDFPTTPGAFDREYSFNLTERDAFAARLSPSGDALGYSTFLGGGSDEIGYSVAYSEASGIAYVTGFTQSPDFPATPGAFDPDFDGALSDAFVAAIDNTGNLSWSTFIGGAYNDEGKAIAIGATGSVLVAGHTGSPDFPISLGAVDTTPVAGEAFVVELDATGSALLYATLLGGGDGDSASSIGLDAAGIVYVTGGTVSSDFPVTPGAYSVTLNGGEDLFVAAIDLGAGRLVYSTYLGGSGAEYYGAVAVDASGSAYVAARTTSPDFPTTPRSYDPTYNGGLSDAFVSRLERTGSSLVNSTFLGGSGAEDGQALALDAFGFAYVAGWSTSVDFPTTPGAFDTATDFQDTFVSKIALPPEPPSLLPPSNLTATVIDQDIRLSWDPSPDPSMPLCNCSLYEIYGGPVPYGLDFSAPIGTTGTWRETTWTDFGAAGGPGESYYTVVAVNATARSTNTNTAGRLTVLLRQGPNSVSLPLEPFTPLTTTGLGSAMGATKVEWMNDGTWDASDAPVSLGQGLLLSMPAASTFTYTGLPASHILYRWGPGFDPGDARLGASVDRTTGDVTLRWPSAPGAYAHRVYRATEREGFHLGQQTLLGTVAGTTLAFTATGEITGAGSRYYMVVPLVAGAEGGTTYSVGVETLMFTGMEAFGVPLRLDAWPAVSALADGIDSSLGLLWLTPSGLWVPHFREMPSGVYDTATAWALGYQIRVRAVARLTLTGY